MSRSAPVAPAAEMPGAPIAPWRASNAGSLVRREHGGGLDAAVARYGMPREAWLDLSTGINPNPYPLPDLSSPLWRDLWQRLPDEAQMDALRRAAAACYGVGDPGLVVPAPGSQAVIQWLPWLFDRSLCVAVLGPTYNEHAASWTAAGHQVAEVADLDTVPDRAAVLVVVNPNNPDGRLVAPERLAALAGRRLVVIDEAFADVTPEVSVASWAGRPNLVALRSVGKFFGLAGLRLGFAVADAGLAGRLHAALGPWAVSGPAAAIGATALADAPWIAACRGALCGARDRLDAILAAHGLEVAGGTALFRLVDHPRAHSLHQHLARAAILTRSFAARPHWLRLGLPADDRGFARLEAALAAWRAEPPSPASARRRE